MSLPVLATPGASPRCRASLPPGRHTGLPSSSSLLCSLTSAHPAFCHRPPSQEPMLPGHLQHVATSPPRPCPGISPACPCPLTPLLFPSTPPAPGRGTASAGPWFSPQERCVPPCPWRPPEGKVRGLREGHTGDGAPAWLSRSLLLPLPRCAVRPETGGPPPCGACPPERGRQCQRQQQLSLLPKSYLVSGHPQRRALHQLVPLTARTRLPTPRSPAEREGG